MDILLCPYSYVCNPNVRKSISLDLRDKIIIFDEAHNIETASEDAFSSELDVSDF